MTLVLSVHSRNCLWVVVDRRLSYGRHRPPKDDAVKIVRLQTADGVGLLAYAGLGATPKGTQPSQWMSAVLRGRGGMTFEQSLGVLTAVAIRELPRHLVLLQNPGHAIVGPAFIRGIGSRLYSIENFLDRKTGRHLYRLTNYQQTDVPGSPSNRVAIAGSGGAHFNRKKDQTWHRALLSLVNKYDQGKISEWAVADYLAGLNCEAAKGVRDGTVGRRSIVVWCGRPDAPRRMRTGGGHQCYTGPNRDRDSGIIPTITNGMDTAASAKIMLEQMQRGIAAHGFNLAALNFDPEDMNRRLAAIPVVPDEELR
jgi:hypothetical protein